MPAPILFEHQIHNKLPNADKITRSFRPPHLNCFFKHKQLCGKWLSTLISVTASCYLIFSRIWVKHVFSKIVPSWWRFLLCFLAFSWTMSWLVFTLLVTKKNGVAKQIMLHGQRDTILAKGMFLVIPSFFTWSLCLILDFFVFINTRHCYI